MANKGAGDVKIESVGIGLDRTCMLMCEDGWREAMVGTISLLRWRRRMSAHDISGCNARIW
ncbi:MAG: hypothetical protein IM583_06285 [Pseudanabaena sp. M114S2SP2A07QC]|jgi:hypothetical protein|nr:hypothetical protein [Pseudanabaena sp. M179S2SP2A07QC]MCA6533451.1 hypothetical protein [Pseudanabaena sp. M176S2SP2A07QC]MCA6539142.1 hypothetical protein [Pseudanabaena sp. M037S2SP2A07QC]MCA6556232.1 hypothetical protein [Pseudanabaena sp. M114S2SP2A07QC]MCA6563787.1 hypothetical protein [Pseudanabaena sp. M151S2SP2A07QC]MCA6578815.1 hypothetical protein [Pseudanabaena sp. M085S1SP2A07QC]